MLRLKPTCAWLVLRSFARPCQFFGLPLRRLCGMSRSIWRVIFAPVWSSRYRSPKSQRWFSILPISTANALPSSLEARQNQTVGFNPNWPKAWSAVPPGDFSVQLGQEDPGPGAARRRTHPNPQNAAPALFSAGRLLEVCAGAACEPLRMNGIRRNQPP
jgi:hypothetical protein